MSAIIDQMFHDLDHVNISQKILDPDTMLIGYYRRFSYLFITSTKNGDCKNVNNSLSSLVVRQKCLL